MLRDVSTAVVCICLIYVGLGRLVSWFWEHPRPKSRPSDAQWGAQP